MLGTGWLTLRQAKAALQNGRLEEARHLLAQPSVRGHRRSWPMLADLTRGYVERGQKHLSQRNLIAAWDDLVHAEELAPADPSAQMLRHALMQLLGSELLGHLEAGDPQRALEAFGRLGERVQNRGELRPLEEAVKDWMLARELADRGEFVLARQMFERVRRNVRSGPGVERFQADLEDRQSRFQEALARLHDAVDERRWRDVLQLADAVLQAAPQHGEARKLRGRAWKSQEPETIAEARSSPIDSTATSESAPPAKRFLLWIDGVGGFLICLGQRVTFGQVTSEGSVDIPLLADVSRLHATLGRDPEGYLIESVRPLQVNGQPVSRATLKPGDRVTLGLACQFLFQIPVPLSTSARLELVSGHRLPISVNGVLLMSESLVIGPGPQAHVVIPDLRNNLVLYRHREGLGLRCPDEVKVNGRVMGDREALPAHANIAGADFAMAIEPAPRMGK